MKVFLKVAGIISLIGVAITGAVVYILKRN